MVWSLDDKVYIHHFFLIHVAPEGEMKTISSKSFDRTIIHYGLVDKIEMFKVLFFILL